MNKFTLIQIVLFSALPSVSYAQQTAPADTVKNSKELQEVVVVGETQTVKPGELSFIPTKRQKEISADAYDLLRQLAMPQILVNKVSDNVTTLTGSGVAMYINGIAATSEELKNLHTKNVIRVEYLDFPSDPRYNNNQHVVNFIVRLPEWGGYTRLHNNDSFFANLTSNSSAFSKFIYKKMQYDMFLGWNYSNKHHSGYRQDEYFSLLNPDGEPYTLQQTQTPTLTRCRDWSLPVNFRAVYNSEKFQAINRVHFLHYSNPDNFTRGALFLTPSQGTDYKFRNSSNYITNSAGWNGDFNLHFGGGYSLNFGGNLEYSKNKSGTLYATDINPNAKTLITDADEDVWEVSGNVNLQKKLSDAHSVSLHSFVKYTDHDIDYSGTNTFTDRLKRTNTGGALTYYGYFPFNLRLMARAGYGWERAASNENVHCSSYAAVTINASYSPNSHHQLNLNAEFNESVPGSSQLTENIIHSTDFMYITGNRNLDPTPMLDANLSYYYIPNQRLYLGAFMQFSSRFNNTIICYEYYADGNALLRSYKNSGDAIYGTFGCSVTYRPIDALQFSGQAKYELQKITGDIHRMNRPLSASVEAVYFLGQCYLGVHYSSDYKRMASDTGGFIHSKDSYIIVGGWNKRNWNITLMAENIFNGNWTGSRMDVISPLYSSRMVNRDGAYHRQVSISVNYTFDYGKKVQHGDEIGGASGGSSAILK